MRHTFTYASLVMLVSIEAFAGSAMTLIPNTTTIPLRSDGAGVAAFTLTNTSTKILDQITINPAHGGGNPSQMSLQNNTCAGPLAINASCSFQVLIQGLDQSSAFTLSPMACAYNGFTCAVATEIYRPTVTVVDVTHPVTAYFALISGVNENNLQPVSTTTQTLGNPIPGFDFSTVITKNDPESKTIPSSFIGIDVAPNGETVYVPNPGSGNVSFVDVSQSTATVSNVLISSGTSKANSTPAHAEPVALVVTPNNQSLYVLEQTYLQAVVINVPTQAITQTISFAGLSAKKGCTAKSTAAASPTGGFGAAISPDGSTVYMSADETVFVINTATNQLVTYDCIAVSTPKGLEVAPDNSLLYVANTGSNTLGIYNTSNLELISDITVGSSPTGVAVSPDGAFVYVSNLDDNTISVINTATNAVVENISLPYNSPAGIAITPDGTLLYVSYLDSDFMSVINTSTNQISSVSVGGNQINQGGFVG